MFPSEARLCRFVVLLRSRRDADTFAEGVKKMTAKTGVWKDAPLSDSVSISKTTRVWFDYPK